MPISNGLKTSLNKIRELSVVNGSAYHQYVPILEDDSDIGQFAAPILQYPEVYNEFVNVLINRIVYTQVEMKRFNNPLRDLEGATMPLGYAGQEIYINPAIGREYNANDFAGLLQKYENDTKVQYLTKNMDLQYPVTVVRTKLKEAFVSWDALDNYINGLTQSLYNGMYIDEYAFTKSLVSSAYKSNNVMVEQVNTLSTEASALDFLEKARTLFLNFQTPSDKYNAWHKVGGSGRPITTWTDPSDIVILIRNDVRSFIDVQVNRGSFNVEFAKLLAERVYPVDNFDVYNRETGHKIFDGSNIVGIICDKSWFKIKPIDQFMEEFRNPNNRSIQYYLNNIKMYEYSLFANSVIFATALPEVPVTALDWGSTGETISGPVGTKEGFEVILTPANGTTEIQFSSSAQGKFTVEKSTLNPNTAIVTTVSAGSGNLIATAGNVTKSLPITVEITE